MNKTIFEGTINGTVYNNVNDYNKEMTRLINEGLPIEASTCTKTVEMCDTCGSSPCMCGDNASEQSEATPCDFHFGFNSQASLVDQYLSGNEKTDDATLDNLDTQLATNASNVMKKIDLMSLKDLHTYLKDVNTMMGVIRDNLAKNAKAQEELESKMTFLDNSENLLNLFGEHYNIIRDHIDKKLANTLCEDDNKNNNTKVADKDLNMEVQNAIAMIQAFARMFGGSDLITPKSK